MFSPYLHAKYFRPEARAAGFGLIELMVSISIMAVIMAVVLARHDRFNGVILLRSQAYEIALQLREIQLSAVSATSRVETSTGIVNEFRSVLGIHFSTNDRNSYKIFQTDNNNFSYTPTKQFGQQGIIDSRFEVRNLRQNQPPYNPIPGGAVSVVFERPDFDARFFSTAGAPISTPGILIDIARVGETGISNDVVRTVEVTTTGQITVLENSP